MGQNLKVYKLCYPIIDPLLKSQGGRRLFHDGQYRPRKVEVFHLYMTVMRALMLGI